MAIFQSAFDMRGWLRILDLVGTQPSDDIKGNDIVRQQNCAILKIAFVSSMF